MKNWIIAARPRTLTLTLATIGMGSFLAASYHAFSLKIFLLSLLTAICLQILSNLANDYGDFKKGLDGAHRQGPQRMVQAGNITPQAMRNGMIILSILSLSSGLWLLYEAFGLSKDTYLNFTGFLVVGLLAIGAAIAYTVGKKPYGYRGLGDIAVFIFFGCVGVLGSFYLHTKTLHLLLLLPATSIGLLATAVLNVNNIRDIESDKLSGKYSIPVQLGRKNAVIYHELLLGIALLSTIIYTLLTYQKPVQWLFLLSSPLLFINGKAVKQKTSAQALDPYLKQMALTALLFTLLFGLGLVIKL